MDISKKYKGGNFSVVRWFNSSGGGGAYNPPPTPPIKSAGGVDAIADFASYVREGWKQS